MNSEAEILAEASKEENLTMKKLLSLLLCLILCFSLFACNGEAGQTTKETNKTQQTEGTKGTPATQSTDNSSKEENAETKYSLFDIADIKLIDSIQVNGNTGKVTFGYFVEVKEYNVVDNTKSVQKILGYLENFEFKKTTQFSLPLDGYATYILKFQYEHIISLAFNDDNKVKIRIGNGEAEYYEIVNETIIDPLDFFKSLDEPTKPSESYPPKIEYEKIETPIVDGKIAFGEKNLVRAFVSCHNFEVKKMSNLVKIKDAFSELNLTLTNPPPTGSSGMPGSLYYSVVLYFNDKTYISIGMYEEYIMANEVEYSIGKPVLELLEVFNIR